MNFSNQERPSCCLSLTINGETEDSTYLSPLDRNLEIARTMWYVGWASTKTSECITQIRCKRLLIWVAKSKHGNNWHDTQRYLKILVHPGNQWLFFGCFRQIILAIHYYLLGRWTLSNSGLFLQYINKFIQQKVQKFMGVLQK